MQERITNVSCDGCGENGDEQLGTAKELRAWLSDEGRGWINFGSLDYCPKCKNGEKAKTRTSIFD
jgi:ssDNA-binding Zn-finger/Zn-ribbon topoisomerase 1